MNLLIKKMSGENIPVPSQHHNGDAGFDLFAARKVMMVSFSQALIPIGYAFEIPFGMVGIIKDRSSMAKKHHMYVSAGVIDATYRGEVHVLLRNNSELLKAIHIGDKIAQMIIVPHLIAECIVVDELSDTDRGDGGFGSTDN